jgi:hypothetical protein
MTPARLLPLIFAAAGAIGGAGNAATAANGPDIYTVTAPDGPAALDVELCFGSDPPLVLLGQKGAGGYLDDVRTVRGSAAVRPDDGDRLLISGARPGDCVAWTTRIGAASADRAARHALPRDIFLLPSAAWLFRPRRPSRPALLRLDLGDEVAASVPWSPLPGGRPGRDFLLGDSPGEWPDLTAFGSFELADIRVPGARIRAATLPGNPAADRQELLRWVEANARAVAAVHGRFPVPYVQVLVVPIGRGGEPVPWAQVNRGGGPGVHFFVNQTYSGDTFLADWTAAHELAHLLLPFVRRSDAWLSEGFASYYQNVSRPRVGLLDPDTAWRNLHAGFRRGESSAPMSLRAASAGMHRHGAYMRVYWSGAAIALIADVRLRQRSGGRESLDTVLGRLADCCLPSSRRWKATELLARLDALGGDGMFLAEYTRWIDSSQFPDYRAAFAALGIETLGDDLRLRPDAGARRLRDAIMKPGGPPGDGQSAADSAP